MLAHIIILHTIVISFFHYKLEVVAKFFIQKRIYLDRRTDSSTRWPMFLSYVYMLFWFYLNENRNCTSNITTSNIHWTSFWARFPWTITISSSIIIVSLQFHLYCHLKIECVCNRFLNTKLTLNIFQFDEVKKINIFCFNRVDHFVTYTTRKKIPLPLF